MMTYCPTLAHSSHQAHHALLVLIRRYLNLPLCNNNAGTKMTHSRPPGLCGSAELLVLITYLLVSYAVFFKKNKTLVIIRTHISFLFDSSFYYCTINIEHHTLGRVAMEDQANRPHRKTKQKKKHSDGKLLSLPSSEMLI